MKQPIVFPVMKPIFDRDMFAKTASETLGIEPYQSSDATSTWLSDEAQFLIALDYLKTQERSVWRSLERASASYAKHLRYAFCVVTESTELLETELSCTRYEGLLIVSGTLREFIDFIAAHANKDETFEMRFIADAFFLLFERLKLSDLFCEFTKSPIRDGTFALKRR